MNVTQFRQNIKNSRPWSAISGHFSLLFCMCSPTRFLNLALLDVSLDSERCPVLFFILFFFFFFFLKLIFFISTQQKHIYILTLLMILIILIFYRRILNNVYCIVAKVTILKRLLNTTYNTNIASFNCLQYKKKKQNKTKKKNRRAKLERVVNGGYTLKLRDLKYFVNFKRFEIHRNMRRKG